VRTIAWEEFLDGYHADKPLAATIGVFDGLHLGHRRLIGKVLDRKNSCRAAAFSFAENPKKLLRPSSYHGDLASLPEKLAGFASLGLDLCVLIDFSGNFSKLAGRDFLSLLRDRGLLSYFAVGSNFRCGHRLDTDAPAIREFYATLGVEAEILEPVLWNGHPVSSSRIRTAVLDGRLDDAAAMLGRPYAIDLRGLARFAGEDGVVEAALPAGRILPPPGSYFAEIGNGDGSFETLLELDEGKVVFRAEGGFPPESVAFIKLTKK